MINEHLAPGKPIPGEVGDRFTGCDKEAVSPIDLGEVPDAVILTAFKNRPACTDCRLRDLNRAIKQGRGRVIGRANGVRCIYAFISREASGDGANQRCIKG